MSEWARIDPYNEAWCAAELARLLAQVRDVTWPDMVQTLRRAGASETQIAEGFAQVMSFARQAHTHRLATLRARVAH